MVEEDRDFEYGTPVAAYCTDAAKEIKSLHNEYLAVKAMADEEGLERFLIQQVDQEAL